MKQQKNMTKEEYNTVVTITVAQTILDCATHSQNDSQMVKAVARDAGLCPMTELDRRILKKGLGAERFKRFLELCKH